MKAANELGGDEIILISYSIPLLNFSYKIDSRIWEMGLRLFDSCYLSCEFEFLYQVIEILIVKL